MGEISDFEDILFYFEENFEDILQNYEPDQNNIKSENI